MTNSGVWLLIMFSTMIIGATAVDLGMETLGMFAFGISSFSFVAVLLAAHWYDS